MTRTDALFESERLMKISGIFFENKSGKISDEIAVSYLYESFDDYAYDYKLLMEKKITPIDYLVIIKKKITTHQRIESMKALESKMIDKK